MWKKVKENGDYWKEIFSNVFFVSQSLEQFVLQILDSSSGLKSWKNIEEKFIRTIEMVEYRGVVHQEYRDCRK